MLSTVIWGLEGLCQITVFNIQCYNPLSYSLAACNTCKRHWSEQQSCCFLFPTHLPFFQQLSSVFISFHQFSSAFISFHQCHQLSSVSSAFISSFIPRRTLFQPPWHLSSPFSLSSHLGVSSVWFLQASAVSLGFRSLSPFSEFRLPDMLVS